MKNLVDGEADNLALESLFMSSVHNKLILSWHNFPIPHHPLLTPSYRFPAQSQVNGRSQGNR